MMPSRKAQLRFKFFENFSNPEKRVLFPHEKNVESFDKIQTIKGEKYPAVILVSKVSFPSTTSNSHKGTRRVLKRGWKMFSVAKKEKLKLQFRRRGRNKTLKCTMPRFFFFLFHSRVLLYFSKYLWDFALVNVSLWWKNVVCSCWIVFKPLW